MMERIAEASPLNPRARFIGVVYLLYFLVAIFGEAVIGHSRIILYDAVDLIAHAFYIAVSLLFYLLFKPVNKSISLLAAIFSFMGCANDLLDQFHLAPYQVDSLVFFGPYCLLLGYLILRSSFLPRALGVLLVLAGVGWLVIKLPFAKPLNIYLMVLGFIAEMSLMLWLIIKGVNVPKWQQQASAAPGT